MRFLVYRSRTTGCIPRRIIESAIMMTPVSNGFEGRKGTADQQRGGELERTGRACMHRLELRQVQHTLRVDALSRVPFPNDGLHPATNSREQNNDDARVKNGCVGRKGAAYKQREDELENVFNGRW